MEDIIKKIILKFKAEGAEEVDRVVKAVGKSLNVRDLDRYIRSIEDLQKRFRVIGRNVAPELEKINSILKAMHSQELDKIEKKLQQIGRVIEKRFEQIEKLKAEGREPEEIQLAKTKLERSLNRFAVISDQYRAAQTVDYGRGVMGFLRSPRAQTIASGVVGAAGAFEAATQFYRDFISSLNRNTTAVAETAKALQMQVFQGDMSRAVLYSDPRRAREIEERTRQLRRADRITNVTGTLAGTAALVAGGALLLPAIAALATGGIAALGAGAAVSGAVGLGLGTHGLRKLGQGFRYFFGGEQEVLDIQRRQEAERRAAAQTLDIDLYRRFVERAGQRAEIARLFNIEDEAALAMRQAFRHQLVREQEIPQLIMPFRRFGAIRAEQLGLGAAAAYTGFGVTRESAVQILTALSTVGRGGPSQAVKDLQEILKTAVKEGIKDSGLIEEYQNVAATLISALGAAIKPTDITAAMNQFMAPGALERGRQIQGILPALSAYGQMLYGQSPIMGAIKTANLLDLVRDRTGRVDPTELLFLEGMSPEQLATLTAEHPVLQRIAKRRGITTEEMQRRVEEFRKTMTRMRGQLGFSYAAVEDIIQKAQAGEALDEGDIRILAQAMGAGELAQRGTPEALMGFATRILRDRGIQTPRFVPELQLTPEEQAKSAGRPLKEIEDLRSAAMAQRRAEITGEAEIDKRMYEAIEKQFSNILQVYSEQVEKMRQQMDAKVLEGSISDLRDALDEITEVLREAAQNIRGTGFGVAPRTGTSPSVLIGPRSGGK